MIRRPLFAALFAVFNATISLAQVPVPALPRVVSGSVLIPPRPALPGTAPVASTAPEAKAGKADPAKPGDPKTKVAEKPVEKPKASARLTQLKTLTFDRRPSAVLKTWSAPPPDPNAPAPKLVVAPAGQTQPEGAAPALKPEDAKKLADELAAFQKMVQLGDWAKVKSYLATLPDEEAVAAFTAIVKSLQPGVRPQQQPVIDPNNSNAAQMMVVPQGAALQFAERVVVTLDDFYGLAGCAPLAPNPKFLASRGALAGAMPVVAVAPKEFDKTLLTQLAGVLRATLDTGVLPEVAVKRFETNKGPFTSREVAKLFVAANLAQYAGPFLPSADKAIADKDFEGLNLLSRHFLALNTKETKAGNLEKAWDAVQSVLANPTADRKEQEESLLRAVELAPRIEKQLGQAWLNASFTKDIKRGEAILATVGTLTSQGISAKPYQTDDRLNALKLQRTAVNALLKAAPVTAAKWRQTLTLLAIAWQKEAEFSRMYDQSASGGTRMRRDVYGNIYYSSGASTDEDQQRMMMMQQGNMPRPVPVADVLKECPSAEWVAAVNPAVRPKLADLLARLHLKAGDEDAAFPLIEELAKAQPEDARNLATEFVRVWTRNHDPNAASNENRYSWFFFSYEQRAEGIPLTRSKQERNLADLSKWLQRVRALPIRPLDDELLVKAFTTCHSSAEVYQTSAIQSVFGPLETLRPGTIAGLAQQMRENLTSIWRKDAVQTQNKTNRKKKDIEAEVLRGYQVATQTVHDGLAKFPDSWELLTAQAALAHDEVNYRQELDKSSDFSKKREQCFALFQNAAAAYAKVVAKLPEDEQSNSLFNQWFAAGLGAVDLGGISEDKQPDMRQPTLIKAAILALPGVMAKKHLDRFANDLFTRMSGAKPHVKFAYLKAGFEVVSGDHPQAVEAKKLYDYYQDLNRELKLDAIIDGPAEVGHGSAFGVFINLKHTRDIERESGGFGKYLQNQTTMGYSYNYGRPPADYRDRFEKATREALKEQFEVLGITFQDDKVTSRAGSEYGWRYTPYAYLLLKARGPQVDKLPPLKIDLDFLDTSGFVVLPALSAAMPIDCRGEDGAPRPATDITVTQTLDERQADKGILILEVKGTAIGLVPPLKQLAVVEPPAGFELTKTDEVPLAVKKFESERDENAILSERVWTLTFKGRDGLEQLPTTFAFPEVKLPTKETLYQRYADADLAAVERVVSLEKAYGQKGRLWIWLVAGVAVLGLVVLTLGIILMRRVAAGSGRVVGPRVPPNISAFAALNTLRELRDAGTVAVARQTELDRDIESVEAAYFSPESAAVDLPAVVGKWV